MTSNINEFLPEATFTQTGSNPATATICWNYQPGYTGSLISVNASDGACPILGFATFVVNLDLPPPFYTGEDSTISFCGSMGQINLFNYLGGYHDTSGTWFDTHYNPIEPVILSDTLLSGIYSYVLYSNPSVNSCASSDTAFITVGNGQVTANWQEDSLQNLSCYGIQDGQAYIDSITGDNGPFTVVWVGPAGTFGTDMAANGGSAGQDSLYLGLWNVTVYDTIGCQWSHDFDLSEPGLVSIDFLTSNPQCFGNRNGSLTAYSANAPGNPVFTITDAHNNILNNSGSNTANNLTAGWYTTTLVDSAGCEITDSVEIINPEPLIINLSTVDPPCYGEETGFAVVDTILNAQGDYAQIDYFWTPNLTATMAF